MDCTWIVSGLHLDCTWTRKVKVPCSSFLNLECQNIYAEYFGTRCLPTRSLEATSSTELAKHYSMMQKPYLGVQKRPASNTRGPTVAEKLTSHGKAVQAAIAAVKGLSLIHI